MFHWEKSRPFIQQAPTLWLSMVRSNSVDVGAEQECNCNAFQCDSVQITLSVIHSAVLTWEKTKMGRDGGEGWGRED